MPGIRLEMVNREHRLPVGRQARLLSLSRGSVYYLPRPVPAADLVIMNRIDKLHLEYLWAIAKHLPGFAGSRMIPKGLCGAWTSWFARTSTSDASMSQR
jgi:putative transposase